MTPFERRLQTLTVLINDGKPHAVVLAERAVEELLATERHAGRRLAVLDALDNRVIDISQKKHGPSLSFAMVLLECIAAYRRALRDTE
jgi:hypothetical protein